MASKPSDMVDDMDTSTGPAPMPVKIVVAGGFSLVPIFVLAGVISK